MGYLDFLDLVLAEELAGRDDRRFRPGLRLSKLPHHKTLDKYDLSVASRNPPSPRATERRAEHDHPYLPEHSDEYADTTCPRSGVRRYQATGEPRAAGPPRSRGRCRRSWCGSR